MYLEDKSVNPSIPKPNLENLLSSKANEIGNLLLEITDLEKNPHVKELMREFLFWSGKNNVFSKKKSWYTSFPVFLSETRDEFRGFFDLPNGEVDIDRFLSVMDNKLSRTVEGILRGEKQEIISTSASSIKEDMGEEIYDFVNNEYGMNINGLNSMDFADLMHAANPQKLDTIKGIHSIPKVLKNYLSSSKDRSISSIFNPNIPELDSLLAVFDSYPDKDLIKNIVFNIEKQKIFNVLSDDLKPTYSDPSKYRGRLKRSLDDLIGKIDLQSRAETKDGSLEILSQLRDYSTGIRDFSLDTVKSELNGQVFPRFYQAEAIMHAYKHKRVLIADDMGTGKTAIAALTSRYIAEQEVKDGLRDEVDSFKTLFVTTNSNKNSAREKIQSYLDLNNSDIAIINGGNRNKQYKQSKEAQFTVINYELLRAKEWKEDDLKDWEVSDEKKETYKQDLNKKFATQSRYENIKDYALSKIKGVKKTKSQIKTLEEAIDTYCRYKDINDAQLVANKLLDNNFDHIVIDEVHNAKRKDSKNAQAVLKVSYPSSYVSCTTGTPVVNGLSDLNTLFNILNVYDDLLDSKREELEKIPLGSREFVDKNKNYEALKRSIENDDIEKIILSNPRMVRDFLRPKMLRRESDLVLDLPELNVHDVPIDTSYFTRMGYEILSSHDFKNASDQLRALQMFSINPELFSERFKPAKSTQMPMIPEEVFDSSKYSPKYQRLIELIKEVKSSSKNKKNISVFSSLYKNGVTKDLVNILQNEFPNQKVVRIDGDVVDNNKKSDRSKIINSFNKEDDVILVATVPTLKEAVELQDNCSTMITLDQPFTDAEYSQLIKRVHRGGQDEDVDIYNLYLTNSIDEGKRELIKRKRDLSDLLLIGKPLKKEELDILNFSPENASHVKGFVKNYLADVQKSGMKLKRDLYGAGAETIKGVLGTINDRSRVYADSYVINMMSQMSSRFVLENILKRSNEKSKDLDGKVLDLASGYSIISQLSGIETQCLEINPLMIQRGQEIAPQAEFRQGVMEDVNKIYGDNKFKHVVYSLAMHYSKDEDKPQLIQDINKSMIKNGHLYITEPTASIDNEGRKNLENVLEENGFEVESSGDMTYGEKTFYHLIARKREDSTDLSKPFTLRTFGNEYNEDNIIDTEDTQKEMDERKTLFLGDNIYLGGQS